MKTIEACLELPAPLLTTFAGGERRSRPRLAGAFNATVHGVNAQGMAFQLDTVLTNISAAGLYFWSAQRVEVGTALLVVSRLMNGVGAGLPAPLVALRGVIVRTDQQRVLCGVAVKITHHEFL